MPADDITAWDACALSAAIHRRALSCRELMQATLARIDALNPRVNALVGLLPQDGLLAQADARDAMLARGHSMGWMHGFPMAIKELSAVAGLPLTMGSPLLTRQIAPHDSLMVARMKAAGGIVVGKSNVPEFGLGSHTYNPVYGTTLNPWDTTRSAGGSSGGAAASLALRLQPVADGSDMMGSLRNPAAWNNVFGLRPSAGRVPYNPHAGDGYVALLGTEGPMGRSVRDVARLLSVMAGRDDRQPLSIAQDGSAFASPLEPHARGLRIGWLGDLGGHLPFEPGILPLCEAALQRFEALGAVVEPLQLGYPCDEVWQTWLTWRRFLVAGTLGPGCRPEETRPTQARGAVGIRPGPGPERPADLCGQRQPHALLSPHGDAVRRLRPAGAAQRAGLALPGRMDLAARNCRPHDGHLPPLDGGGDLRHAGRPAGDERAGGLQRWRPADGPATHRSATGRPGAAECRRGLRADHRRLAGAAAGDRLNTAATTPLPAAPARVLPVLVLAQLAGVSPWFAVNAVMPDLQRDYGWAAADVGTLTSAVQLGFIAGTLLFALLAIADRFSPRRVFLLCSLAGAACTLAGASSAGSLQQLLLWRTATGFFLAGIYPVSMKIAAQWFPQGLGSALGWLIGALVLGSASAHAVRGIGTALPWPMVFHFVAAAAAAGGVLLFAALPERPRALGRGPGLRWRALGSIWTDRKVRASVFGYFGHMWELYTMWVLVPAILATRLAGAALSWAAFVVLAAGAIGCIAGGRWARRIGSARVAAWQLGLSGLCCAAAPWLMHAPDAVFAAWLLLWGITVAGDSPQFSALTASNAPPQAVGSVLTLVNSIGFGISILSIQLFVTLAQRHELAALLPWLGLGPLLGVWALAPLWRR